MLRRSSGGRERRVGIVALGVRLEWWGEMS
jgi:hypothetical protein